MTRNSFLSSRKLLVSAILLITLLVGFPDASAKEKLSQKDRKATAPVANVPSTTLNLMDFGATADGVTDDGPALKNALDALSDAGGGTLFVPSGSYAIVTPVAVDFSGAASAIVIQGAPSETQLDVAGNGTGLNLTSEFVIKVGLSNDALWFHGLDSLLIKDLIFLGVQTVDTDARIVIALTDIEDAKIEHSEFYGLASFVPNGALVSAYDSGLSLEQVAFLGCASNSGLNTSIVQTILWKKISVVDTKFIDYGTRPDFYSKTPWQSPYSWIGIGNVAPPDNLSGPREAIIDHVFLDEGGYYGVSARPDWFGANPDAKFGIFISRLRMNVTNLGAFGLYLHGADDVFIERSHFGWSHNASGAMRITSREALLDLLECIAHAHTISVGAVTQKLTLINSIYEFLESEAQTNRVFNTQDPMDDPVQFVRQQYLNVVQREPDLPALYHWANQLLDCESNVECKQQTQAALATYLAADPAEFFNLTGIVRDENGQPLANVPVTLEGTISLATQTSATGAYSFLNLRTAGRYQVQASKTHYTFPAAQVDHPAGNQLLNLTGTLNRHVISGRVVDATGQGVVGALLTLAGSQSQTTQSDALGNYSLLAGGSYSVTASRQNYTFATPMVAFQILGADQTANFTGVIATHTITGKVRGPSGAAQAGVVVTLTGTQTEVYTSDVHGNFSITVPAEGQHTLTPAHEHHTFSPASKQFSNLVANQIADFTALPVNFTISARATDANGVGLSGVTIQATGTQPLIGQISSSHVTDNQGRVNIALPALGDYVLTPSIANYVFSPASVAVNDLVANQAVSFPGVLNRYRIDGRIVGSGGAGIAGTTVSLSGSHSATLTTDSSGDYQFENLAVGNYVVSVARPNYHFAQASVSFPSLSANQSFNFNGVLNDYSISGKITTPTMALAGVTINVTGSQVSSYVTDTHGNFNITLPAEGDYVLTPIHSVYGFTPMARQFVDLSASEVVTFTPIVSTVQFSSLVYTVSEGVPAAEITVTRTGFTQNAAEVRYSMLDGSADQQSDFTLTSGVLRFEPGEATKSFQVLIADDGWIEQPLESASLVLSDAEGFVLGNQSTATLSIQDTNTTPAVTNPIEDANVFVIQQYADFLGRLPDAGGLQYWTSQITQCGSNQDCVRSRRVGVSAAFFVESEFQNNGGYVYRLYRAALGRRPSYSEFMSERGYLLSFDDVQEGGLAVAAEQTQTIEFQGRYPLSLTDAAFVDELINNIREDVGVDLASQRDDLLADLEATGSRARILKLVADNEQLKQAEYNRAFVLMQYFGYLRRDAEQSGYDFWVDVLNNQPHVTFRSMVCSFLTSREFQERFSPLVPRNDQECASLP